MGRRCCCVAGCPKGCLSHGTLFQGDCPFEAALFYNIGEHPQYAIGVYCGEVPSDYMIRQAFSCRWRDNDSLPEYRWELELFETDDEPDARVFQKFPNDDPEYTIVWKPNPEEYDPLCIWEFVLDEDHAEWNPPPDCTPLPKLCVFPGNACCDNLQNRPAGMPSTLHMDFQYCCGETGDLWAELTLTWNPSTDSWEGSVEVCVTEWGSVIYNFKLYCIGSFETGCGDPDYRLDVEQGGLETTLIASACNCNPFSLTFDLFDVSFFDQCSDEAQVAGQIFISEIVGP